MIFYSEKAQMKPVFGSSAIAGALFGAVHCLAWHFVFPTRAEQLIWRAASLAVAGACIALFLGVTLNDLIERMSSVSGPIGFLFDGFIYFFFGGSALLYPTARICLLILALTSLRSLPPSAFDTVRWVNLVPHI